MFLSLFVIVIVIDCLCVTISAFYLILFYSASVKHSGVRKRFLNADESVIWFSTAITVLSSW